MSNDKAIVEEVIENNEIFRRTCGVNFEELAKGQHPKCIVVCCSDSRIDPAILTNAKLGEIFVIRNAGALLGTNEMGSIEYGVKELKCPELIYIAHTGCGAVKGAEMMLSGNLTDIDPDTSMYKVIKGIRDNIKSNGSISHEEAVMKNAAVQFEILMSSPIIREAVKKGVLNVDMVLCRTSEGKFYRGMKHSLKDTEMRKSTS